MGSSVHREEGRDVILQALDARVWSDVIKVEADTSEVLGNGQVKSWVKTCVLSQEMVGDR